MMRHAQQIFDEELSGEPLSEDVVVGALGIAQKEALIHAANAATAYIIQPTVNGGKRAVVSKNSILKLIPR